MFDDPPTLSLCTRCAQLFRARGTCPHCQDLAIVVSTGFDRAGEEKSWLFAVTIEANAGTGIIRLAAGFSSREEATDAATRALQELVAARLAGRGTR